MKSTNTEGIDDSDEEKTLTTTSVKTKKEVEEETRIEDELLRDSSLMSAGATELRLELLAR